MGESMRLLYELVTHIEKGELTTTVSRFLPKGHLGALFFCAYTACRALRSKSYDSAVSHARVGWRVAAERSGPRSLALGAWLLGHALTLDGRNLSEAEHFLRQSLASAQQNSFAGYEVDARFSLARLRLMQRKEGEAKDLSIRAFAAAEQHSYGLKQVDILNFLAGLCLREGDRIGAHRHAARAVELSGGAGDRECMYKPGVDEAESILRASSNAGVLPLLPPEPELYEGALPLK